MIKVCGLYGKIINTKPITESPLEKTSKLLIKFDEISKIKEYFDSFNEKIMQFKELKFLEVQIVFQKIEEEHNGLLFNMQLSLLKIH